MKYWSNACLGLGVTLIAATIISYDLLGVICGVANLFAGYILCKLSGSDKEEKIS